MSQEIKNGLVINGNGDRVWYKNNVLHREDGPAIERSDGDKEWYCNGERHRDNGLPAIEREQGGKAWFVDGKKHREDGPAVDWEDGHQEWWVNGQNLSEEQFNHYVEMKRLNQQLHKNLGVNKIIKVKASKL